MKTAIITGISSGIGTAIATALTGQSWEVVGIHHKNKPAGIKKSYEADLSDLAVTAELGKRLAKEVPQVDAFIHVAGVWHNAQEVLANKQLADFTPEQIIASMNVGVTSAMVICNALLPNMRNGSIVGISGTFADGAAGWLPYYTSKRSLEDFLVGLSQDFKDMQVFGVSPADTSTPAYQKFYKQYIAEAQPTEAVAEIVSKLLTRQNEFKSGDIIEVRQGETSRGYHV